MAEWHRVIHQLYKKLESSLDEDVRGTIWELAEKTYDFNHPNQKESWWTRDTKWENLPSSWKEHYFVNEVVVAFPQILNAWVKEVDKDLWIDRYQEYND